MTELSALRTYSRKIYDLGENKKRGEFHTGHVHFFDELTGSLEPIDYTWIDRGDHWAMTRASYRLRVAKDFGAPNLIRYQNRFEGASHDLVYEPHSLVWATGRDLADVRPFRQQASVQGVLVGNTIRFPDAFGNGLHFEVTLRGSGFTKELVIQRRNVLETPPTAQHRLVLLSRYQGDVVVKNGQGREWDKNGEFDDPQDEGFRLEDAGGKHSLIKPAYIVESDRDNTRHRCPVVWTQRNGAAWQAKVLPTSVLNQGTYPLRADTITSYYAGAGDGYAESFNHATWDLAHDSGGDSADYTATTARISVGQFASGFNIRRAFFPIDTSGIGDTDTINGATFHCKTSLIGDNNDNDGDDFFVLVGPTSQASNTVLAAGDFDACGAIDAPQEITADRKDFSSIAAVGVYNDWTLNATGLSIISKTGFTLIGLREGHDVVDSAVAGGVNADNQIRCYTSEQASTTDDPYMIVDYTAGGGGSGARALFLPLLGAA